MTAVLTELRRLDAARQRGEITDREFSRIRESLQNAIEDACDPTTLSDQMPETPTDPMQNVRVWHIVALVLVAFTIGTALVTWLVNDFELALTLTATLLAAATVHAFNKVKD